MGKLVLLRHSQSIWNLENKFTGWVDINLSKYGFLEAVKVGKKLINIKFNYLFTSILKRSIKTGDIILKTISQFDLLTIRDKALNERNYGDLQGLNKNYIEKKYGVDKVYSWRRSYNVRPPNGESLRDTYLRVIPFYCDKVIPCLNGDSNVLLIAHGNSLRSLVKYIENLNDKEIVTVDIKAMNPIVYEVNSEIKVIKKNIL